MKASFIFLKAVDGASLSSVCMGRETQEMYQEESKEVLKLFFELLKRANKDSWVGKY